METNNALLKIKSADFYQERNPTNSVKTWTFKTPITLDSSEFNDVTPIEGYDWVILITDNNEEIILDYDDVPYTGWQTSNLNN